MQSAAHVTEQLCTVLCSHFNETVGDLNAKLCIAGGLLVSGARCLSHFPAAIHHHEVRNITVSTMRRLAEGSTPHDATSLRSQLQATI